MYSLSEGAISLMSSVTALVDEVCDCFEAAWKVGQRPSIESYLSKVGRRDRSTLLKELLLLELEYRGRRGESPEAAEYRRRFPEQGELIEHLCDDVPSAAERREAFSAAKRRNGRRRFPASGFHETSATLIGSTLQTDNRSMRPGAGATMNRHHVHSTHVKSLFRGIWPFCDLPGEVLEAMLEQMEEKEFVRDEALICQGERSSRLMVLIGGTAKVQLNEGSHRHGIAEVREGTVLGEMGLLTGEPCTATVTAATPVRALVLSAADFRRLAERHHTLWLALNLLVAKRLGRRPVDILTGKVLNGYRVRRCIGWGGMAVVYEAEQLSTGRRVALKMMSHRLAHDLEAQQRFDREMRICRSLRHPNILRVFDHFNAFGTNFMVLELSTGETLQDLIRREGPLDESRIRKILEQLARALDYVHRRGVCHRDLKPSNVMIEKNGTVKLVDFGLAKSVGASELTIRGSILGTPRYMSPEQLVGKAVDERADVFAFGCMLYEMLTGEVLFPGEDVLEVITRHLRWSLPPAEEIRPGLSDDLYSILQQTLAHKASDRVLDRQRL